MRIVRTLYYSALTYVILFYYIMLRSAVMIQMLCLKEMIQLLLKDNMKPFGNVLTLMVFVLLMVNLLESPKTAYLVYSCRTYYVA